MNTTELITKNISLADKIAQAFRRKMYGRMKYLVCEDLNSIAYLGLTKAANKFSGDNFEPYAATAIKNEIREYVRRESKYPPHQDEFEAESLPKPNISEELERFPPADRKLLKLRYIDGYSLDEIGVFLGIDKSGVSRRLSSCVVLH